MATACHSSVAASLRLPLAALCPAVGARSATTIRQVDPRCAGTAKRRGRFHFSLPSGKAIFQGDLQPSEDLRSPNRCGLVTLGHGAFSGLPGHTLTRIEDASCSCARRLLPLSYWSVSSCSPLESAVPRLPSSRPASGWSRRSRIPRGFGFAWPDTQMGVIKTGNGYKFFASDGAFHPRRMVLKHRSEADPSAAVTIRSSPWVFPGSRQL